jgi:hypothetical protein
MPSRDTRFQPGAASTALAIVFLFLCLYALIAMFYLAGMTERDIGHVFKGLKRLFREGGAVTWAVAFFHVVAMGALGGLGFLSIRGKRIPSAALLLPALAPFLAGVLGTALDLIKVHQALGFADGEHRAVMLAQGFSESLVPAQLGAMSSGMVALGVMTAGAFGLAGLHLPAMATRRAGALGAAAGAGVILIASCIAIRAALGLRPDAGDVAAWGGLISAAFCGGIASLALASIAEHTDPDAAGTIWRKGGMMAAAGGLGLALLGLSDLLDAQRTPSLWSSRRQRRKSSRSVSSRQPRPSWGARCWPSRSCFPDRPSPPACGAWGRRSGSRWPGLGSSWAASCSLRCSSISRGPRC